MRTIGLAGVLVTGDHSEDVGWRMGMEGTDAWPAATHWVAGYVVVVVDVVDVIPGELKT